VAQTAQVGKGSQDFRPDEKNVLLVGASRGLGLGLVKSFSAHGWKVVATERTTSAALRAAAAGANGRIRIERLDIDDTQLVQSLWRKLSKELFDVIFIVAGVRDEDPNKPIHKVPPQEAARLFITNAYSPIFFAETFLDRLKLDGTLAIMTSRLGSLELVPTFDGWEAYRASKAALNILARCFHQRHSGERRTILLVHPGWVKTDLGGADAPIELATGAEGVYRILDKWHGEGGLAFVDNESNLIPW
jgi:NAD(P)-dependent dehydrogenase (short-subunit alcohol dehydrogenase family)